MRRFSSLIGPGLLAILTVAFFWKLVLTGQYTWMDHPDMVNQVLPWFQYQAREWQNLRIPLWEPNHWGGQPLVGQLQPGVVYPLNWLLFSLPLKDGFVNTNWLHWYFVFIHYMAAVFCYWLCRDLKRSVPASILAGIAFGFGGYIGTNNWPQMINGAVWAPLVLLFFLRAMRGVRPLGSIALSGAFLGVAFLSGHHQIPIYITLTMGGVWLFVLYRAERPRLELLRLGVVFGAVFGLTAAAQVLPGLEYGRYAVRWIGADHPAGWGERVPYWIHGVYSMLPTSLLGLVFRNIYNHSNTFIGLVALSLAIVAAGAKWADRNVRLLCGIAFGGLFLALGGFSVGHGVLYALVPMVEKARSPSMAIFVFHFGVAVLVAFGADALASRENRALSFSKPLVRGLAILSGIVFALVLVFKTVRPPAGDEYESLALTAIVALLLAALLHGWRTGSLTTRAAMILTAFLLLTELGNVTGYEYQRRDRQGSGLASLRAHDDLARYLKDQPGEFRVQVNNSAMPFNFGDWYGIEQFNGYLASMTENIYRLGHDIARQRSLLGVGYYIGHEPSHPGQTEVFAGAGGLKIFREPEPQPRVWTVHTVEGVADELAAIRTYTAPDFDLRSQSFVIGEAPHLATCAEADRVRILSRDPNRTVIDADMSCTGLVVLSDTFYPGWKAEVDGVPTEIHEAYGAVRGVVVEAGLHRLKFQYRPFSIYLGAFLTLAGLLGAAVLQFTGRRQ